MITSQEFVGMFKQKDEKELVKFAMINCTECSLQFDGESTETSKKYPHLASYTPNIGDKVIVLHGVVLGKIN